MRTHIELEAEQYALIERKAADLGISMAEYIRRLVERDLRRAAAGADISNIFGTGEFGGDIAVDRKAATAEAIAANIRRPHTAQPGAPAG